MKGEFLEEKADHQLPVGDILKAHQFVSYQVHFSQSNERILKNYHEPHIYSFLIISAIRT